MSDVLDTVKDILSDFNRAISTFRESNVDPLKIYIHDITCEEMGKFLECLYNDISFLIRAKKQLKIISTYENRVQIHEKIKLLIQSIRTGQPGNVVYSTAANLSSIVRPLLFYRSKELVDDWKNSFTSFEPFFQELQSKVEAAGSSFEEIKKIETQVINAEENIHSVLGALETEKDRVVTQIDELENKINIFDEYSQKAADSVVNIGGLLAQANANEKIINNFVAKISARETELEKQHVKTEEYKQHLDSWKKDHDEKLDEVNKLINSAKEALNYKTAEGLSAAMHAQYQESKGKGGYKSWLWLVPACILLIVTLGIGIWLLLDTQPWEIIFGRIALLPITIAGMIFCASRYNKQKQIIEDYAYKAVLAKSFVGFSELLKNGAEHNKAYMHYIEAALNEIHQNPLRNINKSDRTMNKVIKMLANPNTPTDTIKE